MLMLMVRMVVVNASLRRGLPALPGRHRRRSSPAVPRRRFGGRVGYPSRDTGSSSSNDMTSNSNICHPRWAGTIHGRHCRPLEIHGGVRSLGGCPCLPRRRTCPRPLLGITPSGNTKRSGGQNGSSTTAAASTTTATRTNAVGLEMSRQGLAVRATSTMSAPPQPGSSMTPKSYRTDDDSCHARERVAVPWMLMVGCKMPIGTLRLVWLIPIEVDEVAVERSMAVRWWKSRIWPRRCIPSPSTELGLVCTAILKNLPPTRPMRTVATSVSWVAAELPSAVTLHSGGGVASGVMESATMLDVSEVENGGFVDVELGEAVADAALSAARSTLRSGRRRPRHPLSTRLSSSSNLLGQSSRSSAPSPWSLWKSVHNEVVRLREQSSFRTRRATEEDGGSAVVEIWFATGYNATSLVGYLPFTMTTTSTLL